VQALAPGTFDDLYQVSMLFMSYVEFT